MLRKLVPLFALVTATFGALDLDTAAHARSVTVYTVTNTSGDVNVKNSLPWALHQANFVTPGFDRITFDIPGDGPHIINITSTLFVIDQVDIDATSQPGYSGSPLVWVLGSGDVPSIFLLTDNPWGTGTSSVSSIRGFGLARYTANAVTILPSSEGNWIQENWMGFMPTANGVERVRWSGRPGAHNTRGVGLSSSWNVIRWNTISGVENGITIGLPSLQGAPYIGNWITENKIGTNPEGTSTAGYGNAGDGIFLGEGAANNWIGPRNVISGNGSAGIELLNRANVGSVIFGNFIGLDVTGRVALGNGELGILISGWAAGNAVGGSWGGNYIAGNRLGGIAIGTSPWGGSNGNWVVGNTIGLNIDGQPVGYQEVGIVVGSGSRLNSVSGNVIGGQRVHGILVGDQTWRGTSSNAVFANHIGRSATGGQRANGAFGVFLWNTRANWVTDNTFGTNALGPVGQQRSSGNLIR